MNSIRCPQCSMINPISSRECGQCRFPFSNLPSSAYISPPIEKVYAAPPMPDYNPGLDLSIGQRTHLWYRVYCGLLAFIYLAVGIGGIFLVFYADKVGAKDPDEMFITGLVYSIIGFLLFVPFAAAIFFPNRRWNWIAGIVFMAIGMTSCCFWPILIPIFIFWIKPETQAYFGRKT